jgi:hypothetical protein
MQLDLHGHMLVKISVMQLVQLTFKKRSKSNC